MRSTHVQSFAAYLEFNSHFHLLRARRLRTRGFEFIGREIDVGHDAKLWQGEWKLVSVSWNGKPDHLDDAHWVVDGDKYDVVVGGKALEQGNKFTLDPDRKRVDVFHHWTPKGTFGGSLKGIYEVSQDRLRVVYDPTARVYPASFDPTPGAKYASFVFERDLK